MQVETFAGTAADLVTAITMNYAEEAVGLARAARNATLPVVISFTVETDGKLPDRPRGPGYFTIGALPGAPKPRMP